MDREHKPSPSKPWQTSLHEPFGALEPVKGILPAPWLDAPCRQGLLSVSPLHSMHWRAYGDASLQPVLFLHGGPGSGADISHLCFFDPSRHYVIVSDQRGTGQSLPKGSIEDNHTAALVQDIECLRAHLGIKQWIVFGGSWGATLGLYYAQWHATACQRLVLRGLSNSHAFQDNWMMKERPRHMPERLQAFLAPLSDDQRQDPVAAHLANICSDDPQRQWQALQAVRALETGLSDALPVAFEPEESGPDAAHEMDIDELSRARIYLHYWANRKFFDARECLPSPDALGDIPIALVHGQSDWICPLDGARAVCQVLSHAQLIEVPGAGHSPFHPVMKQHLIELMTQD